MQSAIILCYVDEQQAEQCFTAICDYLREHESPETFYVERAEFRGVMIPHAVGALCHYKHQGTINKLLSQIEFPTPGEICVGIPRATEFNLYSIRQKVAQFWKGYTYNGEDE